MDADHFSLVHANEPDGLAKALIKTAEYRAPSPHPVEEFIFYSHPSVENRIRRGHGMEGGAPALCAISGSGGYARFLTNTVPAE